MGDDNRSTLSDDATHGPGSIRYGVERTRCGCGLCQVFCRYVPGRLDPTDLARLGPEPGQGDLYTWAEEHLRAIPDVGEPRLVPARNARGHCHWFLDGRCLVHVQAPFGCAYFDAHMDQAEVDRRSRLASEEVRRDAAVEGPYLRIWRYLCGRGLTAPSGDRDGLNAEMRLLRNALDRSGPGGQNQAPTSNRRPTWHDEP